MAERPAVVAIGDLQGCSSALDGLLQRVGERPALWFTGDLVNRGPDSLGTLRRVIRLGERARTVLGNHDLHLLALAAGARRAHRSDTLSPILACADAPELIDWIRSRPLALLDDGRLLVHAGVLPSWSAEQCVALADEVERVLRSPDWGDFVRVMYGNRPAAWSDSLSGDDRLRVIVNALTRTRFLTPDGVMDFDTKDGAGTPPAGHVPWFDVPGRRTEDVTVVFGHWSTLGLLLRPNLVGLDTGCVWGGALTGVNLATRAVTQVPCPRARDPAGH